MSVLIIICGLMGVGKTSVLKMYEEKNTDSFRISRDEIRNELFGDSVDFDSEDHKNKAFSVLLEKTEKYLISKKTVLVDGILFRKKSRLDEVLKIGKNCKSDIIVFKFVCEDFVALRRIKEDTKHPAKDRLKKYFDCKKNFDRLENPYYQIDTSFLTVHEVYDIFEKKIRETIENKN